MFKPSCTPSITAQAAAEKLLSELPNSHNLATYRVALAEVMMTIDDTHTQFCISARVTSDANYIKRFGIYGVKVWCDMYGNRGYLGVWHTEEYIPPSMYSTPGLGRKRFYRAVEKICEVACPEAVRRARVFPKLEQLDLTGAKVRKLMANQRGLFADMLLAQEARWGESTYDTLTEEKIDKWQTWLDAQAKEFDEQEQA